MAAIVKLRLTMYLTLAVIFAIAFAIIAAIMFYIGAGLIAIIGITALFFLFQWIASPALMRVMGRLKYIGENEYPKLHDMVNRLAKQAGVPIPKIAIAPRQDPNAYVFGRTRNSATLVVHQGLLPMLNDDEMESVLAHEIGHLRHNDTTVMMMISFLPMLMYMIAQNMLLSGMFGGNSRNNNASVLMLVGAAAFIFYFFLQLMILGLSRMRESYADEYSATTTGKPESLASSLLKISASNAIAPVKSDNTAAKSFYIAGLTTSQEEINQIREHSSELKKLLPNLNLKQFMDEAKKGGTGAGMMMNLFSNHPPIYKRVLALAELKKEMKK
ncbi:MAG: M48 family metalloprotease [Candidatus Micrarchaeota archaeon]|nr:M48 family metalloprotease [Candidatus Micrarchaeota archaeon]